METLLTRLFKRLYRGYISFTSSKIGLSPDMFNTVSRGQMMFLAKLCKSHDDRVLFTKRGYTFVEPSAVRAVYSGFGRMNP